MLAAAAAALWLLAALPALAGGKVAAAGVSPEFAARQATAAGVGPGFAARQATAAGVGPGFAARQATAAGVGPGFAARQATAAVRAAGQAAALDCRVTRLGDKSVSWVRSRDLQILSHAGAVFTADARVSAAETRADADADADGASSHVLRIERLRAEDSGRYECQVNTDPKLSLFFNLTVLDEPVPTVQVEAAEGRVVRGARGGAATLACEARYSPPPRALPLPPLQVWWQRAGAGAGAGGLREQRGGVSLDTERWGAARVVSRLTLADLADADAGAYECRVADATHRAVDSVTLLVTDEDGAEAMQRDQWAAGRAPPAPAALPACALAALAALLLR